MVLGDVLRYLRSKGLHVSAENIWYAQRAGHIQRPGKDSAGNFDYTVFAAPMATYFEARQVKRDKAAQQRRKVRSS